MATPKKKGPLDGAAREQIAVLVGGIIAVIVVGMWLHKSSGKAPGKPSKKGKRKK